jgi:2-polyprenyl-6-methoxyphenol hydroxylase-like FAD-dependent oxidoreductase
MTGRQALIIGGSMAGLVTARVLSDHFDQVTLIERDRLTDSAESRKGVPQGRQLHVLLKRGEELLGGLFPDLVPALVEGGAVPAEIGKDAFWYHFGAWKAAVPRGLMGIGCSRAFLEAMVRRRVMALRNVHVLDGHEVSALTTTPERSRVTGAVVRPVGAAGEQTLLADLVVDTSGRGSQAPRWLEMMGRPPVKQSTVKVDVGYATRLFKRPSGELRWKALIVTGHGPENRRYGVMQAIEGGRWIALMAGLLGDHPPADPEGWLRFARDLPVPDLYHALKDAEPEGDVSVHKFPFHQRRHYERMRDLPEGLVVLGDAHCCLNPVYGQGMSLSAISAVLLGEELARARQRAGGMERLSRTFQRALARACDDAWTVSTGEDFRHPGVEGDRPFATPLLLWYTKRIHQVVATDPELALSFYRVSNLVAPLSELMRPRALLRVLKGPAGQARTRPPAGDAVRR